MRGNKKLNVLSGATLELHNGTLSLLDSSCLTLENGSSVSFSGTNTLNTTACLNFGSFQATLTLTSANRAQALIDLNGTEMLSYGTGTVYPKDKDKQAYEAYIREEKRSSQENTRQVVLVKMDSIQKLGKAYPNYFARLKEFQAELHHIFSWCD